ncbi:MAG: Acyltransferase 3 [Gammaproteobacteria bacterium]|jgi:rhamnosyltransferase|nr:Acyltransferase 3 [Gammaproteobacteria bacterium]
MRVSNSAAAHIAAIIVAFRPERDQINRLIRIMVRECRIVYVMDNGGGEAALAGEFGSSPAVQVVDMNGNQGIGAALNHGFRLASEAGIHYVMTFDQDSEPPPGLAAKLVDSVQRLARRGVRVGAVGPRIVDMRHANQLEYPFMRRRLGWPSAMRCSSATQLIEADFLITSGCLVPLAAYQAVGGFDTELFVDFVDMEWCFRARAAGYSSFGTCEAVMLHELGLGGADAVLGMTVLSHSPLRRYYFARNTIRVLRLPHFAAGWKLRLLLSLIGRLVLLPIAMRFRKGWTQHWMMLGRGVIDGVARVGGAYVARS